MNKAMSLPLAPLTARSHQGARPACYASHKAKFERGSRERRRDHMDQFLSFDEAELGAVKAAKVRLEERRRV